MSLSMLYDLVVDALKRIAAKANKTLGPIIETIFTQLENGEVLTDHIHCKSFKPFCQTSIAGFRRQDRTQMMGVSQPLLWPVLSMVPAARQQHRSGL